MYAHHFSMFLILHKALKLFLQSSSGKETYLNYSFKGQQETKRIKKTTIFYSKNKRNNSKNENLYA